LFVLHLARRHTPLLLLIGALTSKYLCRDSNEQIQAITKHQAEKEQKEEAREEAQAARHQESIALAGTQDVGGTACFGRGCSCHNIAGNSGLPQGAGADMRRQLLAAAEDTVSQRLPEGIAIAILLADMTAVFRQHGLTLVPQQDDARALLLTMQR